MTDSTLRQRKGKENEKPQEQRSKQETMDVLKQFQDKMREACVMKARNEMPEGTTETDIQEKADKELTSMFQPKAPPLSGIKHETKAAKDALAEDPYNLQLIFELGESYLQEEKYPEAANVLVRGWKRVGEITEPDHRFAYMCCLCSASYKCKMYKQAYAVLMDMEEPEDPELSMEYSEVACKVYAQNDNLQKSLKAFVNAISKCKDFDDAMKSYTRCCQDLKKVGALEAAKSAVEKLADNDDDKKKMQLIETFSTLKACLSEPATVSPRTTYLYLGVAAVALCLLIWLLSLLESRSLKSNNLLKA